MVVGAFPAMIAADYEAPPAGPARSSAPTTGSPTRCSCPRTSPGAGVVICHGAGVGEGEPLRLRAPLPRPAGWPRSPTTRAATGARRASSDPGSWATRWRCATCCASTRRAVALRGSSMGGFCGDPRRGARRTAACGRWWRCARRPEELLARGLRADTLEGFRADVERLEPWLESVSLADAAASLGPAHGAPPDARARGRAGALHGVRGAVRRGRRAEAPALSSRAATTARCSTTWSCRTRRCGSWSGAQWLGSLRRERRAGRPAGDVGWSTHRGHDGGGRPGARVRQRQWIRGRAWARARLTSGGGDTGHGAGARRPGDAGGAGKLGNSCIDGEERPGARTRPGTTCGPTVFTSPAVEVKRATAAAHVLVRPARGFTA